MGITVIIFLIPLAYPHNATVRQTSYDSLRPAMAFRAHQEPPEAPCVAATVDSYNESCLAQVALEWQQQQQPTVSDVESSSEPQSYYGSDYESYIYSHYPQYAADLVRIMYCESGGDPNAYNPSGCSGLMQFAPSTFYSVSSGDIWDGYDQIDAAAEMFRQGRQNEWTCY